MNKNINATVEDLHNNTSLDIKDAIQNNKTTSKKTRGVKSSITNSKTAKTKTVKKKTTIKATAELKVKANKKTTISEEIAFCVESNLQITIALLSKRAGVSTHRIKKYCKANFIDLEKINKSNYLKMLDPKRIKEVKKQEKLTLEAKKLAEAEKKKQEKLFKSLNKKNVTSTKHKMPIDTSNNEKMSIQCNQQKIKLF